MSMDMMKHAGSVMGADTDKPAKKIQEVRVRHSANGGHIIEHHHTSMQHPMEEHTTKGDAAMISHMKDAMGSGPSSPSMPDVASPDAAAGPAGAAGAAPATAAPSVAM
jgi:hypothetical protein